MYCNENVGGGGRGIQHCAQSQAQMDIGPPGQSHQARTQWPVLTFPMIAPNDETPGDGAGVDRKEEPRRGRIFETIRRMLPDRTLRRGPQWGPLTGQPHDVVSDPEGRGINIRGAHTSSVGHKNSGDTLMDGHEVDIVGVPARGETQGNVAPDIVARVQSEDSEPAGTLRSAVASYPGLNVSPVTQSRMVVVPALSTPTEIRLPSGTVFFRVSWSGRYWGTDLLVSTTGAATSGTGSVFTAAQNGDPDALAGLFINPAAEQNIYAKGKQAISVMVPAGSGFPVPCLVSVECYLNN
jgi:hypothetical protein